jgi:hypothetical protein
MRDIRNLRLEFRIPISPTPGFYGQVRVFDFALRRLGPPYSQARLSVSVGDDCDIEAVRTANAWSAGRVAWEAVPPQVVAEFGIHGTADWRLAREAGAADLVILSDADTVFLRDIDPLLVSMPEDRPAIRGHMAHAQPPSTSHDLPPSTSLYYWPALFEHFGVPWPRRLFDYSMDEARRLPQIPAYFNLGFVALNPAGLAAFVPRIFDFQRAFRNSVDSKMRCQIAVSLIAYQQGIDIDVLPAAYNAANDPSHLRHNNLSAEDIRVLHYLRTDEIDRSLIFQEDRIEAFLAAELVNPANRALQALAREYRRSSIQGRTRRWPAGMRNSWVRRRWRRSG